MMQPLWVCDVKLTAYFLHMHFAEVYVFFWATVDMVSNQVWLIYFLVGCLLDGINFFWKLGKVK
jgi:hypothetical protein